MNTLGKILSARPTRRGEQTIVCTAFSLVVGAMLAAAAVLSASPESVAPAIVTEKGPHHRSWSRVSQETLRDGRVVSRTNVAYVELKNGMHFWDPERNDWIESRSEIEIVDDGAVARHGPLKVRFSADFSAPTVIDVTTPDGKKTS